MFVVLFRRATPVALEYPLYAYVEGPLGPERCRARGEQRDGDANRDDRGRAQARWFGVVETRWPGSIRFAADNLEVRFSDLLYFSYVTLLTIGYGDITPVSPAARALVVLEGLLRMAFTTMLLAVLVAKALGRREDV
jgi:hypothetical protein